MGVSSSHVRYSQAIWNDVIWAVILNKSRVFSGNMVEVVFTTLWSRCAGTFRQLLIKKKFSVVTIHNSLIYMVIIVVQTNAKSFISSRQWWGLPSSDGYFLYFGINFPMGPIDNSVSIGSGDGFALNKSSYYLKQLWPSLLIHMFLTRHQCAMIDSSMPHLSQYVCICLFLYIYIHDDVIKWKHFPRYWSFVREIHRSTVNSPHKGQWRGALMLSLICASSNDWVNTREAGDLRCYRAHYDVIVMIYIYSLQ